MKRLAKVSEQARLLLIFAIIDTLDNDRGDENGPDATENAGWNVGEVDETDERQLDQNMRDDRRPTAGRLDAEGVGAEERSEQLDARAEQPKQAADDRDAARHDQENAAQAAADEQMDVDPTAADIEAASDAQRDERSERLARVNGGEEAQASDRQVSKKKRQNL